MTRAAEKTTHGAGPIELKRDVYRRAAGRGCSHVLVDMEGDAVRHGP